VTRLRGGRAEVRIPVEAQVFSLPQNVQTGSWAYLASYSLDSGALSVAEERY